MCEFFSFISNGRGNYFYFDAEIRKEIKGTDYDQDSHSSIFSYFSNKGIIAKGQDKEDTFNKYEYNPLLKKFTVDILNTKDDSKYAEKWARKLDFKKIVPELIIKSIVQPFELKKRKPTKKDIIDLKEWDSVRDSVWASVGASVRASVRASVGASVWASVGDSVGDSVWASVGDSVWDSFWDSVGASVGDSVWDSVLASVGDSVWASVGAYASSFFDIKYDYDFSSLNRLWERALFPSYDGKTWRLHSGNNADIVYEWAKNK